MLDLNIAYKLKSGIVLRGISNKFWALNTVTGNQYKLNEVSYFIINKLNEQKTIEEIAKIAIKEYKVSFEEFIEDCRSMMKIALDNQIVEEVKIC